MKEVIIRFVAYSENHIHSENLLKSVPANYSLFSEQFRSASKVDQSF